MLDDNATVPPRDIPQHRRQRINPALKTSQAPHPRHHAPLEGQRCHLKLQVARTQPTEVPPDPDPER